MRIKKNNFWVYLLLVIVLTASIPGDSDKYLKISKGIDLFGRVYKEINLNYADEIDPEKFMIAGIEGMLAVLDPYTVYIDESGSREMELFTTGKYGGIGVTVTYKDSKILVVDLLEGYSAARQGIRIGDEIVEIQGNEINENTYNKLDNLMKGEPGTVVSLKVKRPGIDGTLQFNLPREEIIIKNISYAGVLPDNEDIAYIKLSSFNRTAGEELKNAILNIKKDKKVGSVILDLRGNPGGLLDAAIDVTEKFLPKGKLIVSIKGRDTTRVDMYYSTEEPITGDLPVAVLINQGSASASEIVAGAIQDNDRGMIVGENSFGKGLVQSVVPLPYNNSLKITTGKYFTPSGRCIQQVDYSKDNEVFLNKGNDDKEKFYTQNKRQVFSHGGIRPDTTVTNQSESSYIVELIARGMFFKFASWLFNKNPDIQLEKINNDKLVADFKTFLGEEKFDYQSTTEKILISLEKESLKNKAEDELKNKLNDLKVYFSKNKIRDTEIYKNEVIREIRMELGSRIKGQKGRIEESFSGDKQLSCAVKLLKNSSVYRKVLALK